MTEQEEPKTADEPEGTAGEPEIVPTDVRNDEVAEDEEQKEEEEK